jgi:hypothetical protein
MFSNSCSCLIAIYFLRSSELANFLYDVLKILTLYHARSAGAKTDNAHLARRKNQLTLNLVLPHLPALKFVRRHFCLSTLNRSQGHLIGVGFLPWDEKR